ncbi:hypothetical protein NL108_007154 [Boleophthalmus pectinirostris]|nr:hypothetical protein NL108_007154 [Boleophthalmus pectinirostris]
MEAAKLLIVFLLVVLLQVMGVFSGPLSGEEQDAAGVWSVDTWQDYPLERGLSMRLAEIIKRSKAQQFHGLMGRSSGTSHSLALDRKPSNERSKTEDLYGALMGRRSLGKESEEDWNM